MYLEIFFITLGIIFVSLEGHCSISAFVSNKYHRWLHLNDLSKIAVSPSKQNKLRITWISLKMIYTAMYLSFIQYMNNSIINIGKNTYEIQYVIKGRIYKLVIVQKRGPSPVLQIINDRSEDVTDTVSPYLGPSYDWHGNKFDPTFFKCKSLTFNMDDGNDITYGKNGEIVN
jgi:hypothetical protein